MKNYISILLLSFFIFFTFSCTTQREATSDSQSSVITDSTGYDVLIIDPNFDRWYAMRYSESLDRSDQYYSSMNALAARNWNDYYQRGRFNRVIDSYLHYNPSIDYGLEVNRKLFWYFKYIEENYRIRLLM